MRGKRPKPDAPPAALVEVWREFQNHETFLRESVRIRDKRGTPVPFRLQPAQIRLREKIEDCQRRKRPVRLLYLKARQVMVSAGVAGEYFHVVPFRTGQKARIVAHCEDSAKLIFGYYKQLHDSYQPFRGVAHLPRCVKDAEDAGVLEYENGSRFQIQTAKTVEGGRGGSFRLLHLSEYAFWPHARKLMTGLMQSVPDDPDTMVIIESTANGVGNDFHSRWEEACDPASGSEWIPVFFAWWEHPEYWMEVDDPAKFQASLTEEEQRLQEKFGLKLEQLEWRRWTIRNDCDRSEEIFRQEYPAEPDEAFLSSGRPRFSLRHLSRMPVDEQPLVGELEMVQNGPKKTIAFLPQPESRGALTVFKRPAAGHRYVIGVDVAEGIDAGGGELGRIDPDYSVSDVVDAANGEEVAQLRGRIEPASFAHYVALLGEWYQWAYIVPEANGPGLAFIDALLREGYPPTLIYHRQPDTEDTFTDRAGDVRQKIGWKTTQVTRVQLLSHLDSLIREFGLIMRSKQTVRECQRMIYKPNGRAEAGPGFHDDCVFAVALCGQGMLTMPKDGTLRQMQKRFNGPSTPVKNPTGAVAKYGQGRQAERGIVIRL
jgi:hypothetical protein